LRSVGVKPERQPARATPAVGADAGERSLTRAMGVVAEFEAASVRLYNSGLKRVRTRTRTLPPWAFADLIETQIAKPWDEQVHVMAALRVSGPVEGKRKQVESYTRLRGEGWHLSVRAFRTESATLLKQAYDLFVKAAALAVASSSNAAPAP
jgi:hypothetical protein